jgi:preprotein translocase subunit YajC
MQTVKSGDYIFNNDGKFGIVTNVYTENTYAKVQYLLDDENTYNYKNTYVDSVIVIPSLKFANFPVELNKVKPGSLVQIVGGNFCHITRLVTAESGDIYIETTDNDYSTFVPSELNFIG